MSLLGRIAYLQILQHEKYKTWHSKIGFSSNPSRRLAAACDRRSPDCFNQPVKNLVLVKERIADMKATLNVLRTLVDLSDEEIERFEKRGAAPPSISRRYLAL